MQPPKPANPNPYLTNSYRVKVTRVIDGDTVQLDADLGLRVHRTVYMRLSDIDAPEVRGKEKEAGREAKETLEAILENEGQQYAAFRKGKSFDRWVGSLWIVTVDGQRIDVQREMVNLGAAEARE
jgi:micrococcal nuclease